MPPKRTPAKSSPAVSNSPPVLNAVLLILATAYGLWLLVSRGKVSWPPTDLLAGAYTLAGCLALAGPIILARRDGGEGGGGVGELAWMTGGLIVWVHDLAATVKGEYRSISWPTPLGAQAMGLIILAVILAGWRLRGSGRDWSWTNVTGWVLGLFWIALGLAALWPSRSLGLAVR